MGAVAKKEQMTIVNPSEYSLDVERALNIQQAFLPKFEESKGYTEIYASILKKELTPETAAEAKELRLKLVKVRTGIDKIHKVEKDFYLQAGKFVDALKNKLQEPGIQMEANLKEIETFEARKEAERLQALQTERVEVLSQYLEDAHERTLNEMDEDVWQAYLTAKKAEYEARIEAERKAEEERLEQERKVELYNTRKGQLMAYWDYMKEDNKSADFGELPEESFTIILNECKGAKKVREAEIEAQRVENERLKKEAEEREKAAEAERAALKAKADAEREALRVRNDKLRPYISFIRDYNAVLEMSEADFNKELDKLNKAFLEQQKFENEQRSKAEEAKKAAEAEEARLKALESGPDKELIEDFMKKLEDLVYPNVKSESGVQLMEDVKGLIGKVVKYIDTNLEDL